MLGILGTITNPTKYLGNEGEGLFLFMNNIFKFAAVVAGIILIFKIISAGYMYLSAQGDPKKFQQASDTINQSFLGLIIVSGAFLLAWMVSRLTGIEFINNPTIYGP